MRQLHLGIVGFGRLGRACAEAIRMDDQVTLSGVVRRDPAAPMPARFSALPVAGHVTELAKVDAMLICVPTERVIGVVHDLLQDRIPVVECANLHGQAFENHFAEIDRIARHHKTPAIVGAGWDPGALSVFRCLFALLTPKGHTDVRHRPGIHLHHTTAARATPGVREALSTELRTSDGRNQRYVYVELEVGAQLEQVERTISSDPLYLDKETLVIPVDSVAALEEEGHGVLLERRGTAGEAAHQLLLLEARYSEPALTAAVMAAAARALPTRGSRAYSVYELPLGAMWGRLHEQARKDWI